jgi:hypothetical protein
VTEFTSIDIVETGKYFCPCRYWLCGDGKQCILEEELGGGG